MKENINVEKDLRDEISLKDLLRKIQQWYYFIVRKWLTVFLCVILSGFLGVVYAYFKKVNYIATTTFVLEEGEKSGGLGQYAGLASMVGVDIGGGGGGGIFQGDNILALYKSRTMVEKALLSEVDYEGKNELLIYRYIDFNHLREKWAKNNGIKEIQFSENGKKSLNPHTRLQDSLLGTIVEDITKNYLNVVKQDKKLSVIKAEVKATDEYFAKAFNDEIVKNVNDFYIQTKTKKSLANIAILMQKTDSVRSVMNGAISAGAAAVDATPNLNTTRQAQRLAPVQRSQFSAETNKAILGELVKNLELSKIALLKETPLIQVIDKPIFPLNNDKFSIVKGFILGAIIGGFVTVLFLTVKKVLRNIMLD